MTKHLLLILFSFISFCCPAQPVIEYVSFDLYNSPTDNDFQNRFNGGLGLTQITTNGITGGCLTTPNTVSWGNDNAIYCSKYIDSVSYSTNTRIAFKYDTTQLNTSNFDRTVSIFLRPNADFNHYIIASIMHDKKIQIITYGAVNNPVTVTLNHNHWYDFILTTNNTLGAPVYQINSSVQLNDLGLTGLNPPIPAGNSSLTFNDSLLFVDDAVEVSFTATQWGGAKYVDNFRFQGVKSADSCLTTSLNLISENDIDVVFQNSEININNINQPLTYEVYTISGAKLTSGNVPKGNQIIKLNLESGIYILQLSSPQSQSILTEKFTITK